MAKWIHNISGSSKTYQGQEVLDTAFLQIQSNLENEFNQDLTLIGDLASSAVRMSSDGVTDYSTNGSQNIDFLKGLVNSVSISSVPPFGAKSAVINGVLKKFYARNTGIQVDVTTGSNVINYTMSYAWVKIIGIECIGCEALDTAELKVYDNASGTYSGVPNALLNQFGYALNMASGFYSRTSPFDADLYAGMILQITYGSISDKTVGFNIIMNEVKS
jgi:hypothetical protein